MVFVDHLHLLSSETLSYPFLFLTARVTPDCPTAVRTQFIAKILRVRVAMMPFVFVFFGGSGPLFGSRSVPAPAPAFSGSVDINRRNESLNSGWWRCRRLLVTKLPEWISWPDDIVSLSGPHHLFLYFTGQRVSSVVGVCRR